MRQLSLLFAVCSLAACATPPTIVHARSGSTSTLGQLHGRPVVVTFWTEWCPQCLAQQPLLARVAAEEGTDVMVIPVYSRLRPDGGLAEWFKEQPEYFVQTACWANREFLRGYDLTVIPRTFVYGRNGHLVEDFKGELSEGQVPVLRSALRRAGAQGPSGR